jgi:hypothetical protein
MRKADWVKEQKFIEEYAKTGNAKQSCIKAGYTEKNSAQMGYYLKSKYAKEIEEIQRTTVLSMTSTSIDVLGKLLQNPSANIRLQSAKLILEMAGFRKDSLNVNIERNENKHDNKTDEELFAELGDLIGTFPSESIDSIIAKCEKKRKKH